MEKLLALLSTQIGESIAQHEADGSEEVALAGAIAPDCKWGGGKTIVMD